MKPFRITKLANAFFPSGQVSTTITGGAAAGSKLVERKLGGLWVGGSVELSHVGIEFRANAMNRAVHSGDTSVSIAHSAIRSMRREFGFVTGIVVVEHDQGEFRFRCFGAKKVVANYIAAVAGGDA